MLKHFDILTFDMLKHKDKNSLKEIRKDKSKKMKTEGINKNKSRITLNKCK